MKDQMFEAEDDQPPIIPIRTFRVVVERFYPEPHIEELLVEAHSYIVENESVSFTVIKLVFDEDQWKQVQFFKRTLRRYIDIEEIQLPVTSGRAN